MKKRPAISVEEFSAALPAREERSGWLARATMVNFLLLLALVVPFCVLAFRPPAQEEQAQRARLAGLEARRSALQEERTRLRRKSDLIARDPEYLEAMARDRLQMQKDGEVVFRFDK